MKSNPDIMLKPTGGLTPEQARDARARAWAFVLDCWQKKAAETNTSKGGSKYSHEAKGDQCDLEKSSVFGAEGDGTERTGKEKCSYVHR